MLLPKRGLAEEYVFHTPLGAPLPQATYKRMWARLMVHCGCVEWREIRPGTSRPDDILKQVKPTLTPHYFRHPYVKHTTKNIIMKSRKPKLPRWT